MWQKNKKHSNKKMSNKQLAICRGLPNNGQYHYPELK